MPTQSSDDNLPEKKQDRIDQAQDAAVDLADWAWTTLGLLLGKELRKRPPLYLFLSTASKNSLLKRTTEEKAWVRRQQMNKGGISLHSPATAYVSSLSQVIEETAHLFALVHQPSSRYFQKSQKISLMSELAWHIQHEAFARWAQRTLTPSACFQTVNAPPKYIDSLEMAWAYLHFEGYRLGDALATRWRTEEIESKALRRWFNAPWLSAQESHSLGLRLLWRLSEQSPTDALLSNDLLGR
jgi:hypothetical protein